MLLAVHDVMRVELKALFKGLAPAARMVNLCVEMVSSMCEQLGCNRHASLAMTGCYAAGKLQIGTQLPA